MTHTSMREAGPAEVVEGADAALSIRGARKEYSSLAGKRVVVDGVGITVPAGAIHGLLGHNGAGKTTTLKMLLGLVRPTDGVFEVFGEPAASRVAKRRVGFMPEQPYFPPQLSAGQALALYGRLKGLSRAEIAEETTRLLDLLGLRDARRTQLAKYSRGMLQRLGLAQALLGGPDVLVLDEPASGLDPIGQRDVRNLMLDLKSRGVTILLSSHQLSEVEAICDRVTIMANAKVAAEGHIDDLLNTAGRCSVRARDLGAELPPPIAALVDDVAVSGGVWVFSVADSAVREVVDLVADVGGRLVSVTPKRESLEDYFARLLEQTRHGGSGVDA